MRPLGCAPEFLQRENPGHWERAPDRTAGRCPPLPNCPPAKLIPLVTTPLENWFKAPRVCFLRLPSQAGTRRRWQGTGPGGYRGGERWGGGAAARGDGREAPGAGPGCAGGGGRGWGLPVTDGPDALQCFRKGGALRRRRDFGHRAVPQAPVRPSVLPPSLPSGAPIAGRPGGTHRGGSHSSGARAAEPQPAGGSARLRSAR